MWARYHSQSLPFHSYQFIKAQHISLRSTGSTLDCLAPPMAKNWSILAFCATFCLRMSFDYPDFTLMDIYSSDLEFAKNTCNKAISNAFLQSKEGGEQDEFKLYFKQNSPHSPACYFFGFCVFLQKFLFVGERACMMGKFTMLATSVTGCLQGISQKSLSHIHSFVHIYFLATIKF